MHTSNFFICRTFHIAYSNKFGFPTRSDTNRSVQSQKLARSLKYWISVEEQLYYPCSENKDTLFAHMQIVGFLCGSSYVHLNSCTAAPVAEQLRTLFLNHSIISLLCLVWVQAPHWPHVRQAKICLRVCQVVFLGVLPFSPIY